jgi:hypothetical protein
MSDQIILSLISLIKHVSIAGIVSFTVCFSVYLAGKIDEKPKIRERDR